ncbi:zinc finger protein 569-like [Vombatus ursinus]|uniref:zinc finger protein 569-like n=1 Tax=Vombatus ursinus TaxID=29139 RepID=UPI000FFD6551|nr:zinc finger protein 569-like [Vombatus ursinus]
MLENAWNLLSLGLPVPREDVVSYFEQKEAPWMLEQEGLRSCCLGCISGMVHNMLLTQGNYFCVTFKSLYLSRPPFFPHLFLICEKTKENMHI